MCNKCLLDKHRLSPKYNIPKKVLETETLELVDIFILLESCPHQRLEAFSLPENLFTQFFLELALFYQWDYSTNVIPGHTI